MHTATEGLREPVDARTAQLLRRAVLDHGRDERRHRFPPALHVGTPGGPRARVLLDVEPTDPGLRTDMVAALRVAAGRPPEELVWLTRPAAPGLEDVDARWLSAARSAYAEAQAELVFVVVTRRSWWDPRSGVGREWRRLR